MIETLELLEKIAYGLMTVAIVGYGSYSLLHNLHQHVGGFSSDDESTDNYWSEDTSKNWFDE